MIASPRIQSRDDSPPHDLPKRRRAGAGRARGRLRRGSLVTCAVAVALASALLLVAPAQSASSAPWCTAEQGQASIDEGRYLQAIREFGCVIEAQPTEAEGYRGRAEAELLVGRYSDAFRDYARITAFVVPVHPDAMTTIHAGYAARLAAEPGSVPALTGASFARWVDFQYPQAINLLHDLLELRPDDVYGNLFRGSSRVLRGVTTTLGIADLDRAISLAPTSPDVRFIVADAYTYGQPDPVRALAEASLAFAWGLDTPRVHALLAAAHNALGDIAEAAAHVQEHIDQVATELVATPSLAVGTSLALDLVPGRVYEIPVPAVAGQAISIAVSSKDYWDTIAVLLAPDGTPLVGSDDDNAYHAAFDHVAAETGTYRVQVTFFESVNTGTLVVTRD